MTYTVKEIYYTLQGEGNHSGRPAVFCRFTGCNLWSGHEHDRGKAICRFCDTDFLGFDGPGGGKFTNPKALAIEVLSKWPGGGSPYVVCTGGEPLLQLDEVLIKELKNLGFEVAVETNGTQKAPPGLDWVCVSPKGDSQIRLTSGDELKLIYPQKGVDPVRYEDFNFRHFYLQPLDDSHLIDNVARTVDYCLRHPQWKLSTQMHKSINID